MIKIIKAVSDAEIEEIKKLFNEYALSLNFNLCFQNFEEEVKNLPGKYAPPDGKLYLALYKNKPAGCIALRKLEEGICEMKRLYVKPEYRGLNIGKAMAEILINEAGRMGYNLMRLDTVATMTAARKLYENFGFKEIPAYTYNPVKGAVYMQLDLQTKSTNFGAGIKPANFIRLNLWKHHADYIRGQIKYFANKKEAGLEELKTILNQIGSSQMDLYTGKLLPDEILYSINEQLVKWNVSDKSSFYKWLGEEGEDYRNITLPDKSVWTIRFCQDNDKFIHIHPARYSIHTIRVKAVTMQTAVAAIVFAKLKSKNVYSVEVINEARKYFIKQPPLKVINKSSGPGKIIFLLEN